MAMHRSHQTNHVFFAGGDVSMNYPNMLFLCLAIASDDMLMTSKSAHPSSCTQTSKAFSCNGTLMIHPIHRPMVENAYKAPLWVVHRADLQLCLVNAAKRLGVDLRTNSRVVEVQSRVDEDGQSHSPRICIHDRDDDEKEWVNADVIIAADGIRSPTRKAMMQRQGAVDEGNTSQS
jgi:2-polyprenyl-6-methoxyphenol hydroxylase-like FAD-dependent oxidoreductase